MGCVVNATPRPHYPRERPGTHCIEDGWTPGPVWTSSENLTPTGIRSPDGPARKESLYRLSYRDPQYMVPFPIEMHRTDELSSCHNYWVKNRNVAVGYVWTLVYVRRTEPKIQKHRCENLRTWQIETPVHQTAECPHIKEQATLNLEIFRYKH